MKRYTIIIIFVSVLLIPLLAASQSVIAQTGGDYDLSWNSLASGGVTGGGVYTIDSAIGQSFAGKTLSSPFELCAGYLCGVPAESKVYLPLVRK